MDSRTTLLVLFVLAVSYVSDARNLMAGDLLDAENTDGNVDMCSLCEEYATLALHYLEENDTEAQVIEDLHKACFQMHGLKDKCIMLVDYYAPLFFLEVSSVQPEGFCKKVGFCRNAMISSLSGTTNKCDLCHHAVDDVLDKLKDPDTKLEIVELLLKTCNIVEKYAQKCKSMVFEFGPLLLTNAEKFIEEADICNRFHACRNPQGDAEQALVEGNIEMVTSS